MPCKSILALKIFSEIIDVLDTIWAVITHTRLNPHECFENGKTLITLCCVILR